MRERQGALRRTQRGRGGGDWERLGGARDGAVGRRGGGQRIPQRDRRLLPRQPHGELHGEEGRDAGERVVAGHILQLPCVDGCQPDVELARVAYLAPQPGQGASIRRIHVEPNSGALEGKAVAGGSARELCGPDAGRAQPRCIEREIHDRVILRHGLGVGRREGWVRERPGGSHEPPRGCRIGAAQRDPRAALERRRHGLGARHRLLASEPTRARHTAQPYDG